MRWMNAVPAPISAIRRPSPVFFWDRPGTDTTLLYMIAQMWSYDFWDRPEAETTLLHRYGYTVCPRTKCLQSADLCYKTLKCWASHAHYFDKCTKVV